MSIAMPPKKPEGTRPYPMCDSGCGRPATVFTKNSQKCKQCAKQDALRRKGGRK